MLTVVDDRSGRAVAQRPLPYGSVRNPALWDRTLTDLGYARTGNWDESGDGAAFVSRVELTS